MGILSFNAHPRIRTVGILIGALLFLALTVWFSSSRLNIVPHLANDILHPSHSEPFPAIDRSTLSARQQHIVDTLQREFQSQPPGTKYSEGTSEPWCADFVSWIMHQSGNALKNPNSGSWRIPGTSTLRSYYQSVGRFKPGNAGYSPAIGDVMLYDNPSPFGQHTNIVIRNEQGRITTIGGNEPGGIRVYTHTQPDTTGFVSYGTLES